MVGWPFLASDGPGKTESVARRARKGAEGMERLTMRKIREVLRLKWEVGLSNRQIATSCRVTHGTVAAYLRRADEAGLSWPLEADLTDGELEGRLFQAA